MTINKLLSVCAKKDPNRKLFIMSTIHLIQGNPIPPKKDGVMRLYSMRFCPCAQRVRIVLLLKRIPFEVVNINLANKPNWMWDLNSEGKIPVLDAGSEIIVESLDICEYLNDKFPEPPLHSHNEQERNADRKLIQKFQDDKAMFFTVILNEKNKTLAEYAEEYMPILEEYDVELSKRGKFFGGDSPNMVDYMIWPWIERAPVANYLYNEDYRIPADRLCCLRLWHSDMSKLEVIKLSNTLDIQRYSKYYKQYPIKASIQYDD